MTKCTCRGPLCTCGANGIVKDGAGVLVPATMIDAANDNGDWPRSVYDRAGVGYDHSVRPAAISTNPPETDPKVQEEEAQRCRDGVALWDKPLADLNSERGNA